MRQPVSCPSLADIRARWDGDLSEAGAAAVQAHLEECPVCQQEQPTLERLSAALRKGDVDSSIPPQAHERLKSALLERCAGSLTAEPGSTRSRPLRSRTKNVWLQAMVGFGVPVAVAAILLPVFAPARERARSFSPEAKSASDGQGIVDGLFAPGPVSGGAKPVRGLGARAMPTTVASTPTAKEPNRLRFNRFAQDYDEVYTETPSSPPPASSVSRQVSVNVGAGIVPPHQQLRSRVTGKTVYNPNAYLSSTYIGGSGSRDRLEKLIREGVVVQGRRVRLEAFARSYAQAFPIPTRTALNLIANTERTKIVQEGDHTYLQVGLQAMKGEMPRRPRLNLALVIDCSGSMGSEQKLEFARAAALRLVDRLHADDVLSLIAFDDQARLLVPAEKVRDKARIKAQIAALTPGSGTNIYEGLRLGHQEARKHATPEAVNRVVLLSDGEVTAGVSDQRQFQQLVAADFDRDIQTTAVGMGVEFNEELMLAIAQNGKGNYHFLRDAADTERVFARELDELTHVVAKAVRLRIRLADGVGLVRVLGATTLDAGQTRQVKTEEKKIDRKVYEELGIAPNRQREPDEPGLKLLIPGFYRGDHHVVMLELAIPPGHRQRKVADVFLKYKDLVGNANRTAQATVSIDYTPRRDEMIASVDRNVKKNLLGFQTGEALTEAAALTEQGRLAEAVRKVDERMVVLGVAAREWRDLDLDRDGQLLDRYKRVLAQLHRQPQLANGALGQYLKKSLTYSGYTLTR
jgi:Ca-activated chloride channel family protein